MIAIIVAVADNGVIGQTGQELPWHQGTDIKHFRTKTNGHPIIMGSNTYRSIGHPLPNRQNIVVTRDQNFKAPGDDVAHSIEEAIKLARDKEEIFIIGGANLIEQSLDLADKVYLTEIHGNPDGDVKLHFDRSGWKEVSRESHRADENNQYDYDFVELAKK